MNEKMIFDLFEFARNATLKVAQGITEENADIIPNGFPNSLRWQLGHIYVAVEGIVFHFSNETPNLPDGYLDLFKTGTKTTGWNITPPSIEELIPLLSEQVNRVKETFAGRLDEKIANPFTMGSLKLETIGELLSYASFHESEHTGIVKSLKNALK
ncbi:DinB family protein [Neobacillus niacini]|uniref:DinB family protein n=1 Tax=Neobacillus niacini TaxID=86668 RepID=UPI001C8D604C|nr:DinB family protein [Neobacillus niacini]MBY0147496.1 DinB family protein [Neobacillus niacini]